VRELPPAVADRGGVLGEHAYELVGLATRGGREEFCDDPLRGGLVDVAADPAGRDMLLGTV
jgi:hypothetical protein